MAARIRSGYRPMQLLVPESLTEERLAEVLAGVLGTPVKPVTVAPRRPRTILRNRTIRQKGTFPCTLKPTPLWAAAIVWPKGVPTQGCGRVFTTAAMRDAHVAGYTDTKRTRPGWLSAQFPHQCLDRILPLDKRDTR